CEECGIAEVEQAGEADNDVEAERQDGEGERIRRSVNVTLIAIDQRKYYAEDQQGDEKGASPGRTLGLLHYQPPHARGRTGFHLRALSIRLRVGHEDVAYDFVGAGVPNRPVGLKTRISTRIEKMMTSVQRTSRYWPPKDSMSPIRMPPSMAPGILPMPPRTAAVKARRPAV